VEDEGRVDKGEVTINVAAQRLRERKAGERLVLGAKHWA
jgi:hypothetical protein